MKGGYSKLEEMDKAIEIMKAAMEKENTMKEKKETMEEQIEKTMENQTKVSMNEVAEEVLLADEEVASDFAADEEEEDETLEETQNKSSMSFFKNSKSKELAAKDQKIEELNDKLIRSMAEFDNFRKRSDKEKSQMYDIGAKSIVEKILPIVDNFERGLGTISDKEKEGAFAQGIDMIYKQLMVALEEVGVKPIEAVGNEFDPNLHNAVMHGEDENLGINIVSDEFQKGYMYRDTVVRHSMVKVVN